MHRWNSGEVGLPSCPLLSDYFKYWYQLLAQASVHAQRDVQPTFRFLQVHLLELHRLLVSSVLHLQFFKRWSGTSSKHLSGSRWPFKFFHQYSVGFNASSSVSFSKLLSFLNKNHHLRICPWITEWEVGGRSIRSSCFFVLAVTQLAERPLNCIVFKDIDQELFS